MLHLKKRLAAWHYALAGILAVLFPVAGAYSLSSMEAFRCYDGPCLLPLLLLLVPPVAVPLLAGLFALNRRLGTPVPDGWLPFVLFSSVFVQVAISVTALATATPRYREIFFSDLLSVPQGLVVGLATGSVFWLALSALGDPPEADAGDTRSA